MTQTKQKYIEFPNPSLENCMIANPDVMFQIIKKEAKKLEYSEDKWAIKLRLLKEQIIQAKSLGQFKLASGIEKKIHFLQDLFKIQAKGYNTVISMELVKQFMSITEGTFLDTLQDFSRPIYVFDEELNLKGELKQQAIQRKEAYEKICNALVSKAFDNILILNIDHARLAEEKHQAELKKAEEERRKNAVLAKDPIAFGICNKCPDLLFFIADWIDEKCDLTFDKMINSLIDNNNI